MKIKELHPRTLDELKDHIKAKKKSLYVSSKTSTVIVYDQLKLTKGEECVVNLSSLPKKMEMEGKSVRISGPVTWQELKSFARSHGREVMTAPTEELACVLAGIATSATGERAFGFGPLRDHIEEVSYLNHLSEEVHLSVNSSEFVEKYLDYQKSYNQYDGFKNAPFPSLKSDVELLTGTEGQLGVVISALVKTAPSRPTLFLYFNTPKWEEDLLAHFEILEFSRKNRGKILSCELLDENSLSFIPSDMRPFEKGDLIFLELYNDDLDEVFEGLSNLTHIDIESVKEVSASKCLELRMSVPRHLYEYYSKHGLVKKGTDAQVRSEDFRELFNQYRKMAKNGGDYLLFGHFGDCHLHYNFIAKKEGLDKVEVELEEFYNKVYELNGSPFAEHGIGLIKQAYIDRYYSPLVKSTFSLLKSEYDPDGIFFPSGYMSL